MVNIKVDFEKTVRAMKPMHGVGQPPLHGLNSDQFHYLTEAGIPYSRLHDVGGNYGGGCFVDIPNLFRDFDADVNDPTSYDFTFTDWLLQELVTAGVEPYYRLGITIENYADLKAYRTDPPKDFQKWAEICEHVIAHYNEGWANGFHFNIQYWEIWNEADGSAPDFPFKREMWNGTWEQYYELYDVTSKHLKKKFPNIKVGGYASCGFYAILMDEEKRKGSREELFYNFFHGFMEYIKEHQSPIDFFSWHSYDPVDKTIAYERYLHEQLEAYGYGNLETHLNEWNPLHEKRGTAFHNAHIVSMMIAMQDSHTDVMCLYDARIGIGPQGYGALFNPLSYQPFPAYFGLVAFNQLYQLKNETETLVDGVAENTLFALSATDGNKKKTLVVNLSEETRTLNFEGKKEFRNAWVIDDFKMLGWTSSISSIEPYQILMIEW